MEPLYLSLYLRMCVYVVLQSVVPSEILLGGSLFPILIIANSCLMLECLQYDFIRIPWKFILWYFIAHMNSLVMFSDTWLLNIK